MAAEAHAAVAPRIADRVRNAPPKGTRAARVNIARPPDVILMDSGLIERLRLQELEVHKLAVRSRERRSAILTLPILGFTPRDRKRLMKSARSSESS